MAGTCVHPRILQRATTTLRNRQAQFVAQQQKSVAGIEHAIELTEDLQRTTGFAACDAILAGYKQMLAEMSAISPTSPPSLEFLTLLDKRIEIFRDLFILLANLKEGAEIADRKLS